MKSILFLCGLLLLSSCMLEKEPPLVELSKALSQKIAAAEGTYAVAFADLKTGDTLFINEHVPFHASGIIKTPVMIELYKQVEEGHFSLDDSILVKNEFASIVDGSVFQMQLAHDHEVSLHEKIDTYLLIRELLHAMITRRSNLATNILIDLVDARKVTATMRRLGAPDIEVLGVVEDSQAFEKGLINTTTAYDLMKIFEAIGRDEIISEQACAEMLELLFSQESSDIIPAKLPKEVKVAHVTGSTSGVQHDSALVVLANGHEYILVLLSRELPSEEAGVGILADISKMVYDYVVADKHQR